MSTAIYLTEAPKQQRRLMTMATAMCAADTLLTAGAGRVPARARVMGALTSAAFAAAGAYALTRH